MPDDAISTPVLFTCIAGPDLGKRFQLAGTEVVIGRAVDANVLSDDPDVAPRHAALYLKEGKPVCRSLDSAVLFLDGQRVTESAIEPGQQMRLGRSLWQITLASSGDTGWIGRIGAKITDFAGVEKIRGFSAQTMFSEVFKKRGEAEIEDY